MFIKIAHGSPESRLFNVLGVHHDLIIASEAMQNKNMDWPVVGLTSMSILSSENSSFGHTLFMSWKSMQWQICPFFFFIRTILANQHPKVSRFLICSAPQGLAESSQFDRHVSFFYVEFMLD